VRRAFRIVAGVFGVAGVLFSLPFVFAGGDLHRFHNVAFTVLYGVLLGGGLLASAWRPEANVSAFLVAIASGIAGTIAGLGSGDFISGVWYTAPISIVVLWFLHPLRREILRPEGVDAASLALSLVALVPAMAFLLTQAELQRGGVEGDPHWELHHYSGMAAAGLALPLSGIAASVRARGRRLGASLVGLAAAILGAGSLLLPDHVGAFNTVWAWLALAWGVAFLVLAWLGARDREEANA
jgi:hypothetical protein